MTNKNVIIDEQNADARLDHALAIITGLSRTYIQQLLNEGRIQGVKKRPKASERVMAGMQFSLDIPKPCPMELVPENIPLDILYEDEYLLVVNKPAGMVVHPAHGHHSGTLVHALLYYCDDLPGINGVERPGIVHRLDKDTSGNLVVAKTEATHHQLSEMFASHDLDRQYIAWCRGSPSWLDCRIEAAIGRHPAQRKKMCVRNDGKRAVTDAHVEQQYQNTFCRLRLTLHTGRTHQIRIHLTHTHLPILGDQVYARGFNPGNQIPEPARSAIQSLERQALHAEVLGFIHPITSETIRCIAPLPEDLQALSEALDTAYACVE